MRLAPVGQRQGRTSVGGGATGSFGCDPGGAHVLGGIIGIAASLSGIYYRYGGTTTAGFDCSGFTSYVYRLAGKSIPRTAEAQRAASSKVSNPAPGDLIFFGYPAYHVGIYAGNNTMWDSARPGTVVSLRTIWDSGDLSYGRIPGVSA